MLDALAGLANRLLTADASEVDLHTAVCMRLLPVLVGRPSRCLRLVQLHHWQQLAGGALGVVLPELGCLVNLHTTVYMCMCMLPAASRQCSRVSAPCAPANWQQLAGGAPGTVLPYMWHLSGLRPSLGVPAAELGLFGSRPWACACCRCWGRLPFKQACTWCFLCSSSQVGEVPIKGSDLAGVTWPGSSAANWVCAAGSLQRDQEASSLRPASIHHIS